MSIQSEITRITENVANAYSAVEEQGGTLPETQNTDNLAPAILSIPTGEGSSVAVDGMTILEKDGVISTAIGGGGVTYTDPLVIMPAIGRFALAPKNYVTLSSAPITSSFDFATLESKPNARLKLSWVDSSGYSCEINNITGYYVDSGIAGYPNYHFDVSEMPEGVTFVIDSFEYNSNNNWLQFTLSTGSYGNYFASDMTLVITEEKQYVNNEFLNLDEFGYQTAEQVQTTVDTAITNALSAIGVAEEGAY